MKRRALVIGLDGADPDLLERYCGEGLLPNLSRLRGHAVTGRVVAPPGASDDALWSSFATGKPMGEHGRYHGPAQYFSGSYKPESFAGRAMPEEPFWSRLDRRGMTVAALDVPKCPLAASLDHGFQLSDWLVHGRDHPAPVSTPPSVAGSVVGQFGAAPESPCSTYSFARGASYHPGFSDEETRHWIAMLEQSVSIKGRASAHLLAEQEWNLFITVFKEIHCASHLFWDHVDERHPAFRRGLNEERARPVERIYEAIDTRIGSLWNDQSPYEHLLVFSLHGMQSNHTATSLVDLLVERINDSLSGLIDRVRNRANRHIARMRRHNLRYNYDLGGSYCFPVDYNEIGGAIRLNVKGREPSGRIDPGEGYDEACRLITSILLDLRCRHTGIPAVREVVRMQRRHLGERNGNLPDLLALWQTERPIAEVVSSEYGVFTLPPLRARPGNHTDFGFYMLGGKNQGATRGPDLAVEELPRMIEGLLNPVLSKTN